MNKMHITVNDVTWTEKSSRVEKACTGCHKPTRGRIGFVAYCMDCGMAKLVEPIKSVKAILQEIFK
jgi:hypothetical protein